MTEVMAELLSEDEIEVEIKGGSKEEIAMDPIVPTVAQEQLMPGDTGEPGVGPVETIGSELDATLPQAQKRKQTTTEYIKEHIKMKVTNDKGVIEAVPTKYFGDVEFRGGVRRAQSKFVRCAENTDMKVILDLMVKQWKMEQPRLLISVTGGAKSFAMDPILKQNFTVGLSKVAATPGSWIITGGTNAGVMKHVGDALQGSNTLIGVVTWGIVSERESLLNPGNTENDSSKDNACQYKVSSWLTEKGAFLDSNHSHFLLVDDGSVKEFGREIKFRGELESYIVKKAKLGRGSSGIPSVVLVVEGGPGTVGTVYEAVSKKIPVVIIKSSGRAADMLVYALTISAQLKALETTGNVHEELYSQVSKLFGQDPPPVKVKECYDNVIKCLEFEKFFTMSSMSGSDMDLDSAILEALLKEGGTSAYRQLELSLSWNRVDLARDEVFSKMVSWGGDPNELNWITIMALAMNNVEFVQLLLEYGVSISSILTNEVLEFLYGYRSYDKSSPMRYLITKKDHCRCEEKSPNYKIYKKLISYHDDISSEFIALKRSVVKELINRLCGAIRKFGTETVIEEMDVDEHEYPPDASLLDMMKTEKNRGSRIHEHHCFMAFNHPFRELFFWAVLNNMQDMALLFWRLGEEHIAKALIAKHLCKRLQDKLMNQQDIVKALEETAGEFNKGALQLLDSCYKADDRNTTQMLTCSFNQFKGLKILDLALDTENLDFVSHFSVQQIIDSRWMGYLKDREVSLFQLLVSWFIPPLALTLKFRSKTEIKEMTESDSSSSEGEESEDSSSEDEEEEAEEEEGRKENGLEISRSKSRRYRKYESRDYSRDLIKKESDELPALKKIGEFYLHTPIVKFVSHTFGYFVFLVFMAYSAMTEYDPGTLYPNWLDWVLIVTVFGYLVAEIYQVAQEEAPSFAARIKGWASSSLNIFDAFVIMLYVVSLILRMIKQTQHVGHVLYAFDAGFWWLRLMNLLLVNPVLGPYLVMISKMIKDLVTFLGILGIFIISYGVISTSLLTPHRKHVTDINRLRNVVWKPYFHIYGELFAESEAEVNQTRFGTEYHNEYDETLVWLLLALYLLFTNILLLNLLIAIFNDRYVEVKEKALEIWKFKRYTLVTEYALRHAMFPPFSLIGHFISLIRWLFSKCVPSCKVARRVYRETLNKEKLDELLEFECDCMSQLTKSQVASITKSVEEMASDLLEEVDKMKSRMIVIEENLPKATRSSNDELVQCSNPKPTGNIIVPSAVPTSQ